jgi:hypothetical protein
MTEKARNSSDKSRRTFLKAIGATGAATAGIGTLSDNAAATGTAKTQSMNPLNIKVDDIVPANKYLSITLVDRATKEIEEVTALVNDTEVSSIKSAGSNTFLLSVFDVLTNTDLTDSETVPVELQALTTNGDTLVGTDMVGVIDPTNVLDDPTGTVSDTVDSTIGGTTDNVVDSVGSVGALGESSGSQSHQSQMY